MRTVCGIIFSTNWFTFSWTFILPNFHLKKLMFYSLIYKVYLNRCCNHENIDFMIMADLCFEPHQYQKKIFLECHLYVCMYLHTYIQMCTLLVAETFNGFKNLSTAGWCSKNVSILAPKIGVLQTSPRKEMAIFLTNS